MITRVAFCPHCYEADRPKSGDVFVAWGTTHDCLVIRIAQRTGVRGFVPHNFELDKMEDGIVLVQYACAMHGCWGLSVGDYDKKEKAYSISFFPTKTLRMSIPDYNALLKYKRDLHLFV